MSELEDILNEFEHKLENYDNNNNNKSDINSIKPLKMSLRIEFSEYIFSFPNDPLNIRKRYEQANRKYENIITMNKINKIDETRETQELLKDASNIQNESVKSLERSKKMVELTESIAIDTASTLRQQTEQLKDIQNGVVQLESNITRSKQILYDFMKRLSTDKCFLCMLFLLIIFIILVIIFKIKNK